MGMTARHSNKAVAQWMLDRVQAGPLYQNYAAQEILSLFGSFYVHENPDAPLTIQQGVLKAFKDISSETVVYDTDKRCWRLREADDGPNRAQ